MNLRESGPHGLPPTMAPPAPPTPAATSAPAAVIVEPRRSFLQIAFGMLLVLVAVGTAAAALIGGTLLQGVLDDVERTVGSSAEAIGSAADAVDGATGATDTSLAEVEAAALDLEGSVRSVQEAVQGAADALGPLGGPLGTAADRLGDVVDRIMRVRESLTAREDVSASADRSVASLREARVGLADAGEGLQAARSVVMLFAVLGAMGQLVPLWLGLRLIGLRWPARL
jgi:hypothetical protein